MAIIFNATTTQGMIVTPDNSGTFQFQSNGSNIATLTPAPSFSAYQSTTQSLTAGGWTKLQFQTKEWDTANCFDNTTNYRFTPNIAGYYQVSGGWLIVNGTQTEMACSIYKNNSSYRYLNDIIIPAARGCYGSAMIYMNGTTDYIELYAYTSVTGSTSTGTIYTYFQAFLARNA